MKNMFIVFICAIFAFSCKKNGEYADEKRAEIRSATIDKEGMIDTGNDVVTNTAYTCDPTPIPGTWYIKQSYLNAYQHFYQINAKPEYPGGVLCGPTSYMLGAHMIVTAKNGYYPSSKTKVGAIYSKLKAASKFDDANGMYIGDLDWFCNNYDYPVIKTSYKRTTDRGAMKEYIEYSIRSGYPVVVTVQIYGSNCSTWSLNDSQMYDQTNTSYYVSKNGNYGHFILLIGIKINADGSGTIWYKDPLSKTGSTQSASYTRILDAMKYNGNDDYYDAVALFE
jgi:hypothetical protein